MKTARNSKILLIATAVFATIILIVSVMSVTYAVWKENPLAEQTVEIPTDDFNPSEKYLIFRALDDNGLFTDGEAYSYAVVGYTGLVAEVVIPSLHNNKSVTKICTDAEVGNKRLRGNPVITSLTIPDSVTEISAGACADMPLLAKVTILATEDDVPITIGSLAFANCPLLTDFSAKRTIDSDDTFLLGSGNN